MPKLQLHRTWPCGMQESTRLEGWSVGSLTLRDDDKPLPCPLHGLECHAPPRGR